MASDKLASSNSFAQVSMDPALFQEINRLCDDAKIKGDDTPFLLLNVDDVIEKIKQWKLAMPRITPYYAVKCNSDPVLLQTLASLNIGFGCASKEEMDVISELDVPTNRILYSNCCKGATHLQSAAKLGIDLMTFDNESELLKIKQFFPTAKLLLRLMVEKSSAKIQMGTKFGCEFTLTEHLLEAATQHNLSVVGVSFHIGSFPEDPDDFAHYIEKSLHTFITAEKFGHTMNILDIGGGFSGETDYLEHFKEIAECINKAIDEFFPPESEVEIISEPGRFFVTSAFTFFGNIIGKKAVLLREPNIMYFVNEGVYGLFIHTIFHDVPVTAIAVRQDKPDVLKLCTISGQTCDPMDIIVDSCMLPELEQGDWLMFPNMGAYTSSCSTEFNGFAKTGVKYVVSKATLSYLEKFPAGIELCNYLKDKAVVIESSNLTI